MWDCPSIDKAERISREEFVEFLKTSPQLKSVCYQGEDVAMRFDSRTVILPPGLKYLTSPVYGIGSDEGFYDAQAMQWRDN